MKFKVTRRKRSGKIVSHTHTALNIFTLIAWLPEWQHKQIIKIEKLEEH